MPNCAASSQLRYQLHSAYDLQLYQQTPCHHGISLRHSVINSLGTCPQVNLHDGGRYSNTVHQRPSYRPQHGAPPKCSVLTGSACFSLQSPSFLTDHPVAEPYKPHTDLSPMAGNHSHGCTG